jgi:hypothetical protein
MSETEQNTTAHNNQKNDDLQEIEAIRAALIAGEQSGVSNHNVHQIWEQAKQKMNTKYR